VASDSPVSTDPQVVASDSPGEHGPAGRAARRRAGRRGRGGGRPRPPAVTSSRFQAVANHARIR